MKWQIVAAGEPSLAYAREGVADYAARLRHYGSFSLAFVKAGTPAETAARLWKASEGGLRVLLDERGGLWSTSDFVSRVRDWENRSVRKVSFLIGASDGHREEDRQAADMVLALSPLTMQHELALVVLLEQLYRVMTIKRGEPYHR
jgi:23S rRNA (pseudouridine1915-N3)-methyltransferase